MHPLADIPQRGPSGLLIAISGHFLNVPQREAQFIRICYPLQLASGGLLSNSKRAAQPHPESPRPAFLAEFNLLDPAIGLVGDKAGPRPFVLGLERVTHEGTDHYAAANSLFNEYTHTEVGRLAVELVEIAFDGGTLFIRGLYTRVYIHRQIIYIVG